MKLKVEVIADSSGTWAGNGKRFDTFEAAKAYAVDLYSRWTAVQQYRITNESGSVVIFCEEDLAGLCESCGEPTNNATEYCNGGTRCAKDGE